MTMKYIRITFLAICLLQVTALTSYVNAQSNSAPVKIAGLIHLTGEYAPAGKAFREGMLLAQDEVNENGGVKGRQLKVVFEDTQYNMKTVNTLSQKVISVDRAPLAIISNYTEVMVGGIVFEKAKVPLITLWDTSPEIEDLGKYVFGIGVWAPSTSQVAVDYSLRDLKAKTAIVVATNGQWSLAVAQSFAKQFAKSGGRVIEEFTVNPSDVDFRTIATKIVKHNPDIIYAPLSDHQLPFWRQLHSSGYSGARITSDTLNQEIINEIGEISNGIFQTQVADPNNESTRKMLAAYKKRYNSNCEQIFLTALGYDGIHLSALAINKAKSLNTEEITNQLYMIKDYLGAAGLTTINEDGSAIKSAGMFVVKDKRLIPAS